LGIQEHDFNIDREGESDLLLGMHMRIIGLAW
jgi:hypothetical protein